MNILITSIGNKVNLCRYFRRALFNEGGGRLIAFDANPLASGREFVDVFIKAPMLTDASFDTWLVEQLSKYKIDLIIPSRDEDISYLASRQSMLSEQTRCRALVPKVETVSICQDKARFSDWCLDNDFDVPESIILTEQKPDFPLIIKPRIGSGSSGMKKIHAQAEWDEIRKDLDEQYLVQKFIDAPEYTVDLFVDHSGCVRSCIPRKRCVVLHGESVRAEVCMDSLIIDQCSKLAMALSLVGHNTLQCFKINDQVIFCEVNLRYGGGFTLGVEAGADTPRFLVRESLGLDALPALLDIRSDLSMLRVQKDLFMDRNAGDRSQNAETDCGNKKVFCFDLDGTICTEFCRYEDAQPMPHIVSKVNALFDAGHTIIISTARGAASGKSWRDLIESQLKEWGVRYHTLHTNKPYADFYVDNKSLDILDFI